MGNIPDSLGAAHLHDGPPSAEERLAHAAGYLLMVPLFARGMNASRLSINPSMNEGEDAALGPGIYAIDAHPRTGVSGLNQLCFNGRRSNSFFDHVIKLDYRLLVNSVGVSGPNDRRIYHIPRTETLNAARSGAFVQVGRTTQLAELSTDVCQRRVLTWYEIDPDDTSKTIQHQAQAWVPPEQVYPDRTNRCKFLYHYTSEQAIRGMFRGMLPPQYPWPPLE